MSCERLEGGDIFFNPFRDPATGDDRIAERDAIPVVSGKKEVRSLAFNPVHELPITTITEIVLRDGLWDHGAMSESRGAPDSKEVGQIPPGQFNQLLMRDDRQVHDLEKGMMRRLFPES